MKNLGIVEWVDISVAIIGLIVSVTAVVISVFALKQTKRSIEEANRPYVVVYRDYIQVLSNIHEYIIIKNFGKSGATIKSLDFEPNYVGLREKNVFENISNTFIAPGQSISTVTSHNAFGEERSGVTEVTISYHSGKKHYQDKIKLNEELVHDLAFTKSQPSKNKPVGEIIAKATQELLRRGL